MMVAGPESNRKIPGHEPDLCTRTPRMESIAHFWIGGNLAESRDEKYARQYGGPGYPEKDYRTYVVLRPCCACRANDSIEAHHVKTRAAGGTWKDLVPLCNGCHTEYHQRYGSVVRFREAYGVDLADVARKLSSGYKY